MKRHAADELYIVVALRKRSLGGFAHECKSGLKDRIKGRAVFKTRLEIGRPPGKVVVGKRFHFLLQGIDTGDSRAVFSQFPLSRRAEESFEETVHVEHGMCLCLDGGEGVCSGKLSR